MDAMMQLHKSGKFTVSFRFSNLGCYNSTPLTGISSRDSKVAEESRDIPHED